jgi:hypothetical protein
VLCSTQKFADPLAHKPVCRTTPTTFIGRPNGIIVINLDAPLNDSWGTFVVNLMMNLMEEILRAIFPFANETKVKKLTCELSEEYLKCRTPSDYGRASL